jgi:undecaprenyl pyrophosphate synthase
LQRHVHKKKIQSLKLIDFLVQNTNPDDDEIEFLFSLMNEIISNIIAVVTYKSSDD